MSIPGAAAPVQALRGSGTTGRRRQGSDARVRAANDRRAAREPHPGSLEDAPPVVTDANRRRCWQLRQTPSPSFSFSTWERGLRPHPPQHRLSQPLRLGRRRAGEKAEKRPRRRSGAPHLPRPAGGPRRPPPPSQAGDGERQGTPTLTANRRRRRVRRPERARPPRRGGD